MAAESPESPMLHHGSMSAKKPRRVCPSEKKPMRIILTHRHVHIDNPPKLPAETFVFVCYEDFSVGPLRDWNNQSEFRKNRSDYWRKTFVFDLPDGNKMDYVVWSQALPRHDLVELLQRGVSFDDMPETQEFDDLVPKATSIEIWCDRTPSSNLLVWYLSAAFEVMKIDRNSVSLCIVPNALRERRPKKFWSDMLLDTSDRAVPAIPLSWAQWELMSRYWNAATELPKPIDPALVQDAESHILDTFSILMNRHPNSETGLTNLQLRLLRSTTEGWRKMARVVGDAMGVGWDENDHVGDGVLQAELEEMARMVPPLVEIDGTGAMRFCQVRLTPDGATKR